MRVLALYPDRDEDVVNAQLLFYAAAARHSMPQFFAGVDTFVLTILQPQSIEPDAEMVSTVQVAHAELDEFITLFREACEEARAPEPRLKRGEHCRFCPARPLCPAHTAALLDLAQFEMPTPSTPDYLRLLAEGLDLVDAVKDIGKALHDQAKQALHAGNLVPGYALSAGRAVRLGQTRPRRSPRSSPSVSSAPTSSKKSIRSPKQVELRAKARGLKVPQELLLSSRPGVSLCRVGNAHAPVPGRSELVRSFTAALEALQEGSKS